ncbi:DUF6541 family protein [Microbacterium sp. ABRD28]|uniref:DUF6541 family protein n=1 Tax=Microbacterium sp. ABRD28 TaxID=2268461 RepID=UPI00269692DE
MSWWVLAAVCAASVAVVAVPGSLLGLILGLRGLQLWALAWPFGGTVIAVAGVISGVQGPLQWWAAPFAVSFIILAIACSVIRAFVRPRPIPASAASEVRPRGGPRDRSVLLSLGIAASIISVQLAVIFGDPQAISQTFDNVFHLNAVQYIGDTANASPLHVGGMTSASGAAAFYPALWHASVSLIAETTGAPIALAANAFALTISAFAWPAGVLLLTRTVFRPSGVLTVAAGVLSAASPAYPVLMIDYGVLYPYHLALAFLPAAVASALPVIGVGSTEQPRWLCALATLGSLPALVLAHPSAFVAWLVFVGVGAITSYVALLVTRPPRLRVIRATVWLVLFAVVAAASWKLLKPPPGSRLWPPTETLAQALGEAATASYYGAAIPALLSLTLVIGVVTAARRHTAGDIWILAAAAAGTLLYLAVSSFDWWTLRDLLVASWYNNAPRLAAIMPTLIVPVAASGAATLWHLLNKRSLRDAAFPRKAAAAIVLGALLVAQVYASGSSTVNAGRSYAAGPGAPLLTDDEQELLQEVDRYVPPDGVIAGNPWTGTALAYALADRRVLLAHTIAESNPDIELINNELRTAVPGSPVCDALSREGVTHVLDFGDQEVHGGAHPYPGLERLRSSAAVKLETAVGSVSLYEVTGCDG